MSLHKRRADLFFNRLKKSILILNMNIDTCGIPNIHIENIGNKKNPLYAVKGSIELLNWTGYFLYDDNYKLKKNKVVKDGRNELWIVHDVAPNGDFYIPEEQVNAYFYLAGTRIR